MKNALFLLLVILGQAITAVSLFAADARPNVVRFMPMILHLTTTSVLMGLENLGRQDWTSWPGKESLLNMPIQPLRAHQAAWS
ncbi:hypothetical protein Q31b_39330 [Novipirellula aureliae]|uniref:Uncharacterized protein n=1 Tax=Novipirellula aureliae TaxID=2527966 RepID=A0A5C6DRL9_9BACT|nr:hypothetical protein Q31b_39330 [Novipirellula aureliae]